MEVNRYHKNEESLGTFSSFASACRCLVVPFPNVSQTSVDVYLEKLSKFSNFCLQSSTSSRDQSSSEDFASSSRFERRHFRFRFEGDSYKIPFSLYQQKDCDQCAKAKPMCKLHSTISAPSSGLDTENWWVLQPDKSVCAVIGIADLSSDTDAMAGYTKFDQLIQLLFPFGKKPIILTLGFGTSALEMRKDGSLEFLRERGMHFISENEDAETNLENFVRDLSCMILQSFDEVINDANLSIEALQLISASPRPTVSGKRSKMASNRIHHYQDNDRNETSSNKNRLEVSLGISAMLDLVVDGQKTYLGDCKLLKADKSEAVLLGRLQIFCGLVYLLAGNSVQGLKLLDSGIKSAADSSDQVWQAIALQKKASAMILLRHFEVERFRDYCADMDDENLEEADDNDRGIQIISSVFKKGVDIIKDSPELLPMVANTCLKYAIFLATLDPPAVHRIVQILEYITRKTAKNLESISSLLKAKEDMDAEAGKSEVDAVNIDTQVYFTATKGKRKYAQDFTKKILSRSAFVYEKIGMARKSSLLFVEASGIANDSIEIFDLMLLAANSLGIAPTFCAYKKNILEDVTQNRLGMASVDRGTGRCWTNLQKQILHRLIEAAQNAGKSRETIEFALKLLALLDKDEHETKSLLCEIVDTNISLSGYMCWDSPPFFPKVIDVKLVNLGDDMRMYDRCDSTQEDSTNEESVFIFSALSRPTKRASADENCLGLTVFFNVNECREFSLEVKNPSCFHIQVDRIIFDISASESSASADSNPSSSYSSLYVVGGTFADSEIFQCVCETVRLGPFETREMSVSICPLAPGEFVVRSYTVHALGVVSRGYFLTDSLSRSRNNIRPMTFKVLRESPRILSRFVLPESLNETLFNGEIVRIDCELRNLSSLFPSSIVIKALTYKDSRRKEVSDPINASDGELDRLRKLGLSRLVDCIVCRANDTGNMYSRHAHDSRTLSLNTHFDAAHIVEGLEEANAFLENLLLRHDDEHFLPGKAVGFPLYLNASLDCQRVELITGYHVKSCSKERRYCEKLNITVEHGVEIVSIDILHRTATGQKQIGEYASKNLLCLTVFNHANIVFSVDVTDSKTSARVLQFPVTIRPLCAGRIVIFLENLSSTLDEKIEKMVGDENFFLEWIDEATVIKWSADGSSDVGQTKRQGLLKVRDCSLAPGALQRLSMWGLEVHLSSPESHFCARTKGRGVHLTLRNKFKKTPFTNLRATICTQGNQDKYPIAWTGAMIVDIEKLEPQGSFTHSIFLKALSSPEAECRSLEDSKVINANERSFQKIGLVAYVVELLADTRTWTSLLDIDMEPGQAPKMLENKNE